MRRCFFANTGQSAGSMVAVPNSGRPGKLTRKLPSSFTASTRSQFSGASSLLNVRPGEISSMALPPSGHAGIVGVVTRLIPASQEFDRKGSANRAAYFDRQRLGRRMFKK